MALTNCKECGNQVSDMAETCPHCGIGYPGLSDEEIWKRDEEIGRKDRKSLVVIIIFVVICIVILAWLRTI